MEKLASNLTCQYRHQVATDLKKKLYIVWECCNTNCTKQNLTLSHPTKESADAWTPANAEPPNSKTTYITIEHSQTFHMIMVLVKLFLEGRAAQQETNCRKNSKILQRASPTCIIFPWLTLDKFEMKSLHKYFSNK